MAIYWAFINVLLSFVCVVLSDPACATDECVPLSECDPTYQGILYPCHNGLNLYCCPTNAIKNQTTTNLLDKKKRLFPVNCGVTFFDNKITGGKAAELGQFPWMALLGYKQTTLDFLEFLCGGTVISESYILTAAHCLNVGKNHELILVRLGEHNIQQKRDCQTVLGTMHCADDPVDLPVLSYVRHKNYDTDTLKNDVALVKVKIPIKFTDFIQPICLPFERQLETKDLTGQKFIISGWGKTDSRNLGGSPVLQYAKVTVWNNSMCSKVVPPEVQPITNNQLCANGKKEDACKGDSGGPLFNSSLGADGEIRNFQVGIVSFASTLTCGVEELPPIYTRVDRYLDWVIDNISE